MIEGQSENWRRGKCAFNALREHDSRSLSFHYGDDCDSERPTTQMRLKRESQAENQRTRDLCLRLPYHEEVMCV